MQFQPHDYQTYCIEQIVCKPRLALFLEMGLGKTVITLTAVNDMLGIDVGRVLVIAPLRVAQSGWAQESRKWDHLQHLRVARVLGTEKERITAVESDSDIYVINRENAAWLVGRYERCWKWDMLVIDELSSFKSPQARRFKALRRVMPQINRVVGLTGTPAPNSLIDLWSQIYLIDGGERLGRFIGRYREAYFKPVIMPSTGIAYKYNLKPGADRLIYNRIRDICISMKAADHIVMPERVDNVVRVSLGDAAMAQYCSMERDMLLELNDDCITATSAATVTNKLLQMANGGIYSADGQYYQLHTAKLDALTDIIESANGKPVLVYYGYRFDLEMITDRLGDVCEVIGDEHSVAKWNNGDIKVLLAHPDSAGHGLNLQAGGHIIVWYGLTWSLEKYQQACARLHRQGQQDTVIIHHIVADGTIDEAILKALQRKEKGQDALLYALNARISTLKYENQAV